MKRLLISFLSVMFLYSYAGPEPKVMNERNKITRNMVEGQNSSTDACCFGCVGCCCCVPVICACIMHEKYINPVKISVLNIARGLGLIDDAKEHQE